MPIPKTESSSTLDSGENMRIMCSAMAESSDNTSIRTTIDDIMKEFQEIEMDDDNSHYDNYQLGADACMAQTKNYELNYTIKELALIYKYYGLGRTTKMKKLDMVQNIVFYENLPENIDMVERRKLMWEYMCELKADPLLKKYILSP